METLGFRNKCAAPEVKNANSKAWRKNDQFSTSKEPKEQDKATAKGHQPKTKTSVSPCDNVPSGINRCNCNKCWTFAFFDNNGINVNKIVTDGLENGTIKYSELQELGYYTRYYYIGKDGSHTPMKKGSEDFKIAEAIVKDHYSQYN
jgi:hypothetical protein